MKRKPAKNQVCWSRSLQYRARTEALWHREWGGETMISTGQEHQLRDLESVVARVDSVRVRAATYSFSEEGCELISIHATVSASGRLSSKNGGERMEANGPAPSPRSWFIHGFSEGGRRDMQLESIVLTGQRVKLIPLKEEHIEGLYEAANYPEIWAYMPMKVESTEDMKNLVAQALDARNTGTEYPFVIIDLESDKILGSTRFLDISIPHRNLEIGWTWLTPKVWRTRVNTECKYLLMQHGFESFGAIRVQLKTDRRNTRSQAAIERLGAVKEGVLRHHRILPDGYVRDSVYYSVIDEEWPLVKQRLEAMLQTSG